jgi:glycosyltransferase involved in cell wall biosynthesis
MHILILTPTILPSITGNAITAERWRRSLQGKGIVVTVMATQNLDAGDFLSRLRRIKPDLIHVHHAFRSGNLLLEAPVISPGISPGISYDNGFPLVVSPGGTDINLDFEIEEKREIITRVYRKACSIIAQDIEMVKRLGELFPFLRERIIQVPKAFCWLGDETFNLKKAVGCKDGEILFFLPAGIRPVKGNLECLKTFKQIHSVCPGVRIVFAGPALDSNYAEQFDKELEKHRSFATWIPLIPPGAMRSAYESSDIVLNTSFSEGLSNVLLEAIAAGRPVLASNIPGNRWPVLGEEGKEPVGLLFEVDNPEDLIVNALKLIDDEKLRQNCIRTAKERASRWPSPEDEANGLIRIYETAISSSHPPIQPV